MRATSPIYSFRNGVNYDDSLYMRETRMSETGTIPFTSIQHINGQAQPGNLEFDTLVHEIEDVYHATYTHTDRRGFSRRGQFEFSTFNAQASSEAMKLIVLGWGSDYKLPGTLRGIAALALADPQQRFAVCNFMGRGDSTPLPLSRSLAIARTGSFISAGELLHDALGQSGLLHDTTSLDVLGESEGHRVALSAVASGLEVQQGTFVDGPGAVKLGYLGLAQRLQKKESKHGKRYVAHSTDMWSQELDAASDAPGRKRNEILDRMIRGVGLAQYVLHPMGLSKAGLERDTYQALPYITDELAVISLEASEITDHLATEYMMGTIARRYAGVCPPIIRHRVGKSLTHAYNLAGPGARSHLLTVNAPHSNATKEAAR